MKKFQNKYFLLVFLLVAALIVPAYLLGLRITYNPNLENDWTAISSVGTWVGAIGTVIVLWYNHKTIILTQQSVQQSINLQLYDKRQSVYDEIFTSKAFTGTPENIKILYSDEIYELHKEISQLCKKRRNFLYGFAEFKVCEQWDIENLYNVCKGTINDMVDFLTPKVKAQADNVRLTEEQIKKKFDNIQEIQVCTENIEKKRQELQLKMEQFLKKSIGNE